MRRRKRRIRYWPIVLIVAAIALAGASLFQPYAGFQGDVLIEFPKGTTSAEMGQRLAKAGVVRYAWQFLLVRIFRPTARLQAGEYRFGKPASAWEVFRRIVRGDVVYYELVVPEGYNLFEIAQALEEIKLMPAQRFLQAARNPSLVADIAPRAPTLEGYLFPSTYHVPKKATADQICKQMTAQFRKVWSELQAPEGTDVHAVVTLASMVEKETAIADERPLVASVYANRLRLGMKLDCDPTAAYAAILEGHYRGAVLKADLERDHPYNTYKVGGLPPGPIANPGRASLEAALRPAQTKFLYFVAKPDGSGKHVFSTDISAHHRAVAQYRRGRR
jgi:UPF0755 protein